MLSIERERNNIAAKLLALLTLAGITNENFAKALDVSKGTLNGLLKADNNYGINLPIKAAEILGMRFEEFISLNIQSLPIDFRVYLIEYHKFIDSEAFVFIKEPPAYKYAITSIMNEKEMEDYTRAGNIIARMMDLYEYRKRPGSISNELKNLTEQGVIQAKDNPDKSHHKLYRRAPANRILNASGATYIPSYIKISKALTSSIKFDILFKLSEILLFLLKGPAHINTVSKYIYQEEKDGNVEHFFTILLDRGWVLHGDSSDNEKVYTLTEAGFDIVNAMPIR